MCIGIQVKYLLLLLDFNQNFDFLDRFSKNTLILNIMKILLVGAESFRMDVWTKDIKV